MTDVDDGRLTAEREGLSRRSVLKGAGASSLALTIAACTSSGEVALSPTPTAVPPTTEPTVPTPTNTPEASPTATPEPTVAPPPGVTPTPATAGPLSPDNLNQVRETWDASEPWVWRPDGTNPLTRHVVEDVNGLRFSYDGSSPGPTVRMQGDETLYVKIHNQLGRDDGTSTVGPNPDPAGGAGYPGPEGLMLQTFKGDKKYALDTLNKIPTIPQPDWALGEHLNGVHSAHVTNLHTHGLHVRPGQNDNKSYSDDIFLRIIPKGDAIEIAKNPELWQRYQENREEILGNVADFEFQLGNVMQGLLDSEGNVISGLPHPPGTHWYHPHAHGATQNQVASGMAGFLIIEGDIEQTINEKIAGDPAAEWDQKTGQWQYRERAMFLQRLFRAPTVNAPAADPDANPKDPIAAKQGANRPIAHVNGTTDAHIIVMQPGAIERWRVLNGSVDGAGYMRLAVLKGLFEDTPAPVGGKTDNLLKFVDYSAGDPVYEPVTVNDYQPLTIEFTDTTKSPELIEKAPLWQLAWDGVTLIRQDEATQQWKYHVRNLDEVNGGAEPDFKASPDDDPFAVERYIYDPANMALCYNRPNEVAMSDANRTDVFFQAPKLDGNQPQVYTVVALPLSVHGPKETTSKVLAHVVVRGEHVEGDDDYPFESLFDDLTVSPYELPVSDAEVEITDAAEKAARGIGSDTMYRTRTSGYGGWGAAAMPLVTVDDVYVDINADNEKLIHYVPPSPSSIEYTVPTNSDPVAVTNIQRFPATLDPLPAILLPPNTRTMNIDGEKFFPTDEDAPSMLLNTAEEWVVYNHSIDLYGPKLPKNASDFSEDMLAEFLESNQEFTYYSFDYVDSNPPEGAPTSPQPWYGGHIHSYPMTLTEVTDLNAIRAGGAATGPAPFSKVTGAADHPFHIHQNPFWLMRIEVPDVDGNLVNVLPEPRWADVIALPRNGGRVVFRSRFVDYEGEFVNHCHILLHEDNGMMQRVAIVGNPADSNYTPSSSVSSPSDPRLPPSESWTKSLVFEDQNNSGQSYPGPGFTPNPPTPPTS